LAKLVYIGGYGRSGSTLLEYLLTTHPAVVACGEVERHLRSFGRKKVCTCGRRAKRCPVWGAFQHKKGRLEGWDHEQLVLALLEHVSREYAVMADSSKTAWGSSLVPFWLRRSLGENFLLVHIVRDPRAVAWSTMRAPRRRERTHKGRLKVHRKGRHSSPGVRSLRTVAGWTTANLACEIFGLLHPDRYLRVRYEDLVRAPLKVVGQVLAKVSLDPPVSLDQSEVRGNRHQLHGNAMRFETLSPADLKEDAAWKTAMPKGYRRLIGGLSWPLCLRYAYGSGIDERGRWPRPIE
jgi:hypothetical protein